MSRDFFWYSTTDKLYTVSVITSQSTVIYQNLNKFKNILKRYFSIIQKIQKQIKLFIYLELKTQSMPPS